MEPASQARQRMEPASQVGQQMERVFTLRQISELRSLHIQVEITLPDMAEQL